LKLSLDKRSAAYFHNDFLRHAHRDFDPGNSHSRSESKRTGRRTYARQSNKTVARNAKSFKERNFNLCNIRYFEFFVVQRKRAREREREREGRQSRERRERFNQLGERDSANNCTAGKSPPWKRANAGDAAFVIHPRLPIRKLEWEITSAKENEIYRD